jgi:choline dehydrogenase-like flavoprotein
MRASVQASEACGLKRVHDFAGAEQSGVSPYPLNVVNEKRINTGTAYLTDDVRSRPAGFVRPPADSNRTLHRSTRAGDSSPESVDNSGETSPVKAEERQCFVRLNGARSHRT